MIGKGSEMILHTEQSILRFEGDFVEKKYKRSHMLFDKKYFISEVFALSELKDNKNFIDIFNIDDCSYSMKRHNFSLGNANCINFNMIKQVLFSIGIDRLLKNLDDILHGLKEKNIEHRDINPGNLLFCSKEKILKLTDFFWCSKDGQTPLPRLSINHPWPVNGVYSTDDEKAIKKIKAEISDFYSMYFKPEEDAVLRSFVSTVGHGKYQDGSSVYKGFAYHVVNLPQFKNKIKYHKSTCVDEYRAIKKNLPFAPESFVDIGMSCGYFTFNLLRDFKIKRCLGFEADPAVCQFLNNAKSLYYLKPLVIKRHFSDDFILEKDYDIAIFLNSHMWIYKQLGKEKTLEAVANVLKHCRYLFFQTCGAYSSGMYKVEEYKKAEDIENMLIEAGGKDIKIIGTFVGSHDAPRHMFRVKGNV